MILIKLTIAEIEGGTDIEIEKTIGMTVGVEGMTVLTQETLIVIEITDTMIKRTIIALKALLLTLQDPK